MRPLIGISTSEVRSPDHAHPVPQGDPRASELALGRAYMQAVERAGGLPVILAPVAESAIPALLGKLDGVVLSGGPDLDPAAYGARAHPDLGPTQPDLDRFELALARAVLGRGLPLLGICRGLQVLNVAAGGTLVQHLPDVVGEEIRHRQTALASRPTHAVRVQEGSVLARVLGRRQLQVNSLHHQAVRRPGDRVRPVAWAHDGTVEGIEVDGARFALAVQWHAECLAQRAEQRRLFEALVAAAVGAERPVLAAA